MNQINKHRIEKIRIELTLTQKIGHYSFALIPMIPPAMELYYQLMNKQKINSFSTTELLVCFCLSALIVYLKYKELISERLCETRTDEQFKEAVFATANKMKWSIEKIDNNSSKAVAANNDGSEITISRQSNYVEIKSLSNMFISVPDIFGTNKKHRRAFLRNYILTSQVTNLNDRVIDEIESKEKQTENESEWNLKNTFKRVIAYLFCLGFLSLGIAIWKSEGFSFLSLFLCLLGLSYIIFDIYVVWTKRNKTTPDKR